MTILQHWHSRLLIPHPEPHPASTPTPTPEESNEVGWQSIFWSLFTLALLVMTQPSVLDDGFQQSSMLFPARASPFVCITDILEVLVHLIYEFLTRKSLRTAAFLVCLRRQQDRHGPEELEKSVLRLHPKASVVLFLGISTQVVKIYAFQGIFWAKIIVTIYLVSYIVLAGVSLLARDDGMIPLLSNPTSEDPTPSNIRSGLGGIALAASFIACSWAIFQVCDGGKGTFTLMEVMNSHDLPLGIFLFACLLMSFFIRYFILSWTWCFILGGLIFAVYKLRKKLKGNRAWPI